MKIVTDKYMSFHAFAANAILASWKNRIYKGSKLILLIRPGIFQFSPLMARLMRTNISSVGILKEDLFFSVIRKKNIDFRRK